MPSSLPLITKDVQRRFLLRLGFSLQVFYFIHLFAEAAYYPYINLHFQMIGMTGSRIGFLSSVRAIAVALAPPVVGLFVDKYRSDHFILPVLWLLSAISASLFLFTTNFALIMIISFVASATFTPITPIMDARTISYVRNHPNAVYSRIRLWGSIGFLVANLIVGKLIEWSGTFIIFIVFSCTTACLCCFSLYATRKGFSSNYIAQKRFGDNGYDTTRLKDVVRFIWSNRQIKAFYLCGLVNALAGTAQITFFSILAYSVGMRESLIGVAWGIAVASEITVLYFLGPRLQRVQPRILITIAGVITALRFTIYALFPSVAGLLIAQAFHGLIFSTGYIGTISFINKYVPENYRVSSQSLSAAVKMGIGGSLGGIIVGVLYDVINLRQVFLVAALTLLINKAIFLVFSRSQ